MKKSFLAIFLIALNTIALLAIGNPIGPFLFAFSFIGICTIPADLYIDKVNFYWQKKKILLLKIYLFNIIFGFLIGKIIYFCWPALSFLAIDRISLWQYNLVFFIKSVLCGSIMSIAVKLYNKNNYYGILLGTPLFIFMGLQHSIINVILLGISNLSLSYFPHIILHSLGNFLGAILIDLIEEP